MNSRWAFDINVTKVGKDLSEAIFAYPNNTIKFTDVPNLDVPVVRGMTHDGLGKYLSQVITKAPGPTADIVKLLKDTKTDVVVNYLPVGSEDGHQMVCGAGSRSRLRLRQRHPGLHRQLNTGANASRKRGLPIMGDDIKSQVGATIMHRVLTSLFVDRGVRLDRTYQLNFGGNTDFLNMLERERLESKKISKTGAVTSMIPYKMDPDNVHVGPSDHVPWLTDRKWCYIRMEGTTFGDVPLNLELKLEVWDSPNSAGVVIDAVRCAKLALDRGLSGPIVGPSSYFFKTPPKQFRDDICREKTEAFIKGQALLESSRAMPIRIPPMTNKGVICSFKKARSIVSPPRAGRKKSEKQPLHPAQKKLCSTSTSPAPWR